MLKRAGETYPLISQLVAQLSVKEGTRRECGCEPSPRIINDLQQKKPLNDKWLRLLSDGKNKTDGLFSSKNMVMENIKGRLKMKFPYCNCFPAITKFTEGLHALHAPKSRTNVLVVLKDRYFDVSYL